MSMYPKTLINRDSVKQTTIELIENSLSSADDASKHYFHKIMVRNWTYSDIQLYEILYEYFNVTFVPVNFSTLNLMTTFYTSSLSLIMKIINFDFVFPFNRHMFSIHILLNDKTSLEMFRSKITLEDIVAGIVSNRFNEDFVLDLSNFCNDHELVRKKIHFYKVTLLSHFKLLMLRMGRDTKMLKLNNNNLSEAPTEIMNFFMKGDLLGVDLSNNNIPSIAALHRINSKIEKLWIEGNPLCEDLTESDYIREAMKKFPRLVELDGVRINNSGILMPFRKYYILNDNHMTQVIVEEFVTRYFSHYDSSSRRKVGMFYDMGAKFSLSSNFNDIEKESMPKISMFSRNFNKPNKNEYTRFYKTKDSIVGVLCSLPRGRHDLTTFKIDVILDFNGKLVFIIDGVFKEEVSERYFSFRRTFIMKDQQFNDQRNYLIIHEMFTIFLATKDLKNSYKCPTRHIGDFSLIKPTKEEKEIMIKLFTHLTQLKRSEVESRMTKHSWDIKLCLNEFYSQLENKKIDDKLFLTDDEMNHSLDMIEEID